MFKLLIIVVCELVLIRLLGYIMGLVFFDFWFINMVCVKYFRFIWCTILVLGGIMWKFLKVFWFYCKREYCFLFCSNFKFVLSLKVFCDPKWFICMEWLMIKLVGCNGLIFWGLLFMWIMVFCMVVKFIIVGIFVKFCNRIWVIWNVILVFWGGLVGF